MKAKIGSLLLALAALSGAVIYAQQKANKAPKQSPVFDTSKSGTPTPIEEVAPAKPGEEPTPNQPSPGVTPPMPAQTNQPEKKHGKKKKPGDMTIMPSSKSMTPPPTKSPEPTRPLPPT